MTRRNHKERIVARLRSALLDTQEADEALLRATKGTLLRARVEWRVAVTDLGKAIKGELNALKLAIHLWWISLFIRHKRLIGEMGLRAHRPGGNAYDRRQHYRHPVRHSVIHLWRPAFQTYKGGKNSGS